MILDLFLIATAIVLVVDCSGVMESVRGAVAKWLHAPSERVSIKPLDCSKCLTVWVGLGYALIVGEFSLPILCYVLLLGVMTPNIATLVNITTEAVRCLLEKIYEKLC